MAAPFRHSQSSVRKWGGIESDYLPIHRLLDSSKDTFSDARHRALTHTTWFCTNIIPKIFGDSAVNNAGRIYIPKDVAELHCLEDFHMRFIPTVQDFLENMRLKNWMINAFKYREDPPSSMKERVTIDEEERII